MIPRALRLSYRSYSALRTNQEHEFAARHALCLYRSNAIYTMIPKNGCSTLRLTVAIENGCLPSAEHADWIHDNNGTFRAGLRDLACADFTFVVLRCPFARLASAYLHKLVLRHDAAKRWIAQSVGAERARRMSFREFVDFLAEPDMLSADIHWRPQVDFLVYERYDRYFGFERFGEVASELRRRLGVELVDARQWTRHGTDQFTLVDDATYADAPPETIAAMHRRGLCPSHAALYDASTHAAVSRLYADDISFYRETLGDGYLMPQGA